MTTPYNLSAWRTVKIEPVTLRLPDGCSYHLSYWRLYRARRHVDPCVDPLTRATLAHSYNFCGNCLVIIIIYSSVKVWLATPPRALRKPRQYIYQIVRLGRESCGMTFGSVWTNHGDAIPKKPGHFSHWKWMGRAKNCTFLWPQLSPKQTLAIQSNSHLQTPFKH